MPSRKAILNITSTKKKDHMTTISEGNAFPTWHQIPMNGVGGGVALGSAQMLWCPTFREPFNGNGNPGNSREKDDVFWRGVKEKMSVRTNNNNPVRWRRIVFESAVPPNPDAVPPGMYTAYSADPVKGAIPSDNDMPVTYAYYRAMKTMTVEARRAVDVVLFKGEFDIDWSDHMVAATDNSQVKILYDKTTTFNNPNDAGVIKSFNRWHPFNKTMSYVGDEFGTTIGGATGFSSGKRGTLGNVFIYDLFDWMPTDETGKMWINSDACCYWHER